MREPNAGNAGNVVSGYVELAKIAEPLLKQLEELTADSKCDALLHLLATEGTATLPDRRICIFTRFVDTATYLGNMLETLVPASEY